MASFKVSAGAVATCEETTGNAWARDVEGKIVAAVNAKSVANGTVRLRIEFSGS
ncbi:MAG: hypothetical protein RBT42_14570 [Aquabacterium sp.]|nr:hypothetical protein [Aquabacterium sp.]